MTLLSFSCYDLKAAELKELDLEKLRSREARLGVSLVAVK
jgi:hypothetical protein